MSKNIKTRKSNIFSSLIAAGRCKENLAKRFPAIKLQKIIDILKRKIPSLIILDDNNQQLLNRVNEFLELRSIKKSSLKTKHTIDEKLIKIIINESPNVKTLKEINSEYRRVYSKSNFTNQTLRRFIRNKMNYTLRKIPIYNKKITSEKANLETLFFMEKFTEALEKDALIVFMDESSFLNRSLSKRMWVNKDDKTFKYNEGRLTSLSVIAAVCKDGLINFNISKLTYNSQSFIEFIKSVENELWINKKYSDKIMKNNVYIILDNAKTHTSKITRKELANVKMNFIYQPSYRPSFNVTELLWATIKNKRTKEFINNM